jgi:hypothetical protein
MAFGPARMAFGRKCVPDVELCSARVDDVAANVSRRVRYPKRVVGKLPTTAS